VYWIYNLPSAVFAMLVEFVFVSMGVGAVLGVKRFLRNFKAENSLTNDMVGTFFGATVGLYGLTLGLISVGAWQNYSEVEMRASDEASSIAALFRDLSNYPEPHAAELTVLLKDYTRYVIDEAWPLQKNGQIPVGGTTRVNQLQLALYPFEPRNQSQIALHQETLRAFNHFVELRRKRLYSVTSSLPALVWYVVLFGALITMLLSCLFHFENLGTHLLCSGLYASVIGALIFLMAAMDNPYRGDFSVGPEAFELVFRQVMATQGTVP
jgi:Protein of unknown function (DUF4239)